MKKLTYDEIRKILSDKLESDYSDESVELGENWELIAEIFYKFGFESKKDES